MTARAPAPLAFLAFGVCVGVWGSTWYAIKVGYAEVPAFTAAALRFLIAAAVLLVVHLAARVPWPQGRRAWSVVAFVGLVQFFLDYALIYWGEQHLSSGLTAVLFATLPLFTAGFAHLALPGERLAARRIAGILLGIVGVAVLFQAELAFATAPPLPMLAILASAACAGAAAVVAKRWGGDLHPVAMTSTSIAVGAVGLAALAVASGQGLRLPTSWLGWWPILYLALAGSVVTFLLYYWLLRRWSATGLSFLALLTPVVALLLGAVLLDEPVTPRLAAGTGLVLAGVALATLKR